jgi:hypothetical protein
VSNSKPLLLSSLTPALTTAGRRVQTGGNWISISPTLPPEEGLCHTAVRTPIRPVPYRTSVIPAPGYDPTAHRTGAPAVAVRYTEVSNSRAVLRAAHCLVPADVAGATYRAFQDRGRPDDFSIAASPIIGAIPCDSPWQVRDPDTHDCSCENGSDEWDCWVDWGGDEPNDPPCDPMYESCDGQPGGGSPPGGSAQPVVVSLDCGDGKPRGEELNCVVRVTPDGASYSARDWHWWGDNWADRPGPSSGSSWGGTAIIPGTMTVTVAADGFDHLLEGSWTVHSRQWPWTGNVLSYEGAAPASYDGSDLSTLEVYGWTCEFNLGCRMSQNGAIHPSPASRTGYSVAQVTTPGPNGGTWYVTGAYFTMYLATNVNPHLTQAGTAYNLSHADDLAACSPSIQATVFSYNHSCRQQLDMTHLINHVWDHERAHITAGMQIAQSRDPRQEIEGLFAVSDSNLRDQIFQRIDGMNSEIVDHIITSVHCCQSFYGIHGLWQWANGKFNLTIKNAF